MHIILAVLIALVPLRFGVGLGRVPRREISLESVPAEHATVCRKRLPPECFHGW